MGETMTYSLSKFFAYIKNREMFDREQEAELYERFKNHGDEEAREKLILSQSRLVLRHVARYTFRFGDKSFLVEYFNVGMCAVMHVVDDLFDPNKGKLASIAFPNISDAIRRYAHEQCVVKGMSLANSAKIKRETGEVVDTKIIYPPILFLDSKINTENFQTGTTLSDAFASECATPEEIFADLECSEKLKRVLVGVMKSLTKREQMILRGRLFSDGPKITLEVLGNKFNITRERARQIEKKAKRKIVNYLRTNYSDCREDFGLLV